MAKSNNTGQESIKCTNMMYEQQLRHLPKKISTIRKLKKVIETEIKPEQYAMIVHDKDTHDDGTPVEPHVHVFFHFSNARSINNICKLLGEGDKTQQLVKWDDKKYDVGFLYLIHGTPGAANRHQYSVSEVISNPEAKYADVVLKASKRLAKTSRRESQVPKLLDDMYLGKITREAVEQVLTGTQYAYFKRQIEDISRRRQQVLADEWREKNKDKPREVIWISGASEVGKSSFARKIAETRESTYFFAGSTRDMFQNYRGEHVAILDELRPGIFSYSDILKMLDTYSAGEVLAPSRYFDKALAVGTFIITSPFNPLSFYLDTFHLRSDTFGMTKMIDSFQQLLRRLSVVIEMDETGIYYSEYDPVQEAFVRDLASKQDNPYSKAQRSKTANMLDGREAFNALFTDETSAASAPEGDGGDDEADANNDENQ